MSYVMIPSLCAICYSSSASPWNVTMSANKQHSAVYWGRVKPVFCQSQVVVVTWTWFPNSTHKEPLCHHSRLQNWKNSSSRSQLVCLTFTRFQALNEVYYMWIQQFLFEHSIIDVCETTASGGSSTAAALVVKRLSFCRHRLDNSS